MLAWHFVTIHSPISRYNKPSGLVKSLAGKIKELDPTA